MMKTKQTPAQERAQQLREGVQEAQDEARGRRKDLEAHAKETERQRAAYAAWLKTTGNPVDFAFWPSQGEGQARGVRTLELESAVRAAEGRLRLLQDRLRDADRLAGPLSDAAMARLEELAGWAQADAELAAAMDADPFKLLASRDGRDRLLKFAADHGLEVSR